MAHLKAKMRETRITQLNIADKRKAASTLIDPNVLWRTHETKFSRGTSIGSHL